MSASALLTDRYSSEIIGTLSCYDRIVITGTIPRACYAQGMTDLLNIHQIRILDYAQFAQRLRDQLVENAQRVASENGLEIDYLSKPRSMRKESRIAEIISQRGDHPGLVHIFSVLEPCDSYKPWHNKNTGRTYLKSESGKCLHYYFYFIDEQFGLCYLRVPTYLPCRLQFYCNAHNWLANQLRGESIDFTQIDNTLVRIDNWARAQALADAFPVDQLHQGLDAAVARYCPIIQHFETGYHWSVMQIEYATDIVFAQAKDLKPLYETLVRTAVHSVKPENVATFLGRPLDPRFAQELGTDYHTRIEGTRIKHHMGRVSIKMYDKIGRVLRIETTANDLSFFKHYRKVEHKDGSSSMKWAPLPKTIYSMHPLITIMAAANRRYIEFISSLIDPTPGVRTVEKLSVPVQENQRTYRGFNLFDAKDLAVLHALTRGQFCITGLQNSTLRQILAGVSGAQASRILKRLRLHGLIKRVAKTYKYHLTKLGKTVVITALKLRELVVIPQLAGIQTGQ